MFHSASRLVGVWLLAAVSTVLSAKEPLLKPNDTLALVGGTFIERMQSTSALEGQLYCRQPNWNLRVRNLGWSGDDVHGFARKVFDTNPQRGFERLLNDLKIAKPTVVLVAYGFAEASNGPAATDAFEPGLRKLVESLRGMNTRVILMKPFIVPGVRTAGYAEQIERCGKAIEKIAAETESAVVTARCDQWTDDGLAPSELGYETVGDQLAAQLVGGDRCEANSDVKRLIVEKNELFFHRHRPQNETYLMLFRKHEQGNNVVELPQFDPLIDSLEQRIWGLTSDKK